MAVYLARIEKRAGPGGGSPIHLLREGDGTTVCSLVEASKLEPPGIFDDHICPACVRQLEQWARLERSPEA